jgi:hypothetical protein
VPLSYIHLLSLSNVSHFPSVCLSLSLSNHSHFPSVCMCVCLSLKSFSFPFCLSVCMYVCLSLSLCHSIHISLLSLSLCTGILISLSVSNHYNFLSVFFSLTLCDNILIFYLIILPFSLSLLHTRTHTLTIFFLCLFFLLMSVNRFYF